MWLLVYMLWGHLHVAFGLHVVGHSCVAWLTCGRATHVWLLTHMWWGHSHVAFGLHVVGPLACGFWLACGGGPHVCDFWWYTIYSMGVFGVSE